MDRNELFNRLRPYRANPGNTFGGADILALRTHPQFQKLISMDGRDDVGECGRIYTALKNQFSETALRHVLLENWSRLPEEMSRINVCYCAYDASAMTTETALELFLHPASGTRERHLLAAGLAVTESSRHLGEALQWLSESIGKYADERRQRTLDKFLNSIARMQLHHHVA